MINDDFNELEEIERVQNENDEYEFLKKDGEEVDKREGYLERLQKRQERIAASCLAKNVKLLRKELGMTVRELADRAGVSKALISSIEVGRTCNPRLETVRNIAIALGTNTGVITGTDKLYKPKYCVLDVRTAFSTILEQYTMTLNHQALNEDEKVILRKLINNALDTVEFIQAKRL